VDTTELFEGPFLDEDNLLGMRERLVDYRPAVEGLLRRIAETEPPKRQSRLAKLVILSGLR
jgi:hypothetical protein